MRKTTAQEWGDRTTNRPTEYNSLDDKYARVITEELMPALYKEYNISKDPEMHGIGGSSSGAIAAFTVARERPDHFRKVLSNVGSFVNLRGGHVYPEKALASEKKPIRLHRIRKLFTSSTEGDNDEGAESFQSDKRYELDGKDRAEWDAAWSRQSHRKLELPLKVEGIRSINELQSGCGKMVSATISEDPAEFSGLVLLVNSKGHPEPGGSARGRSMPFSPRYFLPYCGNSRLSLDCLTFSIRFSVSIDFTYRIAI